VAEELFRVGVDLLTSGNHIWDKKEAEIYIATERRLLRPANYPGHAPGSGVTLWEREGTRVGVINLQGRVFMPTIDCPFKVAEYEIDLLKQATDHAEATSEKQAFARFVDGRVSAVIGTHTHVQTADEQILPGGTAFISDVGMTGPSDSVIGMEASEVIGRFLTQIPAKFRVAKGTPVLSAVVIDLEEESGRAKAITRLQLREEGGGLV
jgi:metallophosphoesterase (TIGR00282 family)